MRSVLRAAGLSDRWMSALREARSTVTSNLDGAEGRRWIVTTARSEYWFDLVAMTVRRFPGPAAHRSMHDRTRSILEIKMCTVGQSGYWLMRTEGRDSELFENYWQLTTPIVSIRPIPDED